MVLLNNVEHKRSFEEYPCCFLPCNESGWQLGTVNCKKDTQKKITVYSYKSSEDTWYPLMMKCY